MILRVITLAALIALSAAVALALMVLAASVLRPVVQWIAADERAPLFAVAVVIIGLAVVMDGRNQR